MVDEEAIDLGKRAIFHATHRDAMSGGINNCERNEVNMSCSVSNKTGGLEASIIN